MRPRRALAAGALAAVAGATIACLPALGPDDSLLTSTRILAIRADPAEARPGTPVTFTSLVAGPTGTVTSAGIVWSFCLAPLPPTEDNVVSNACLGSSALVAAGTGAATTATTPANGCALFGPNVQSSTARPRDPDPTGGYYQPLRADLSDTDSAFALARIRCDLAGADAASAMAFAASYQPNENPTLLPITATSSGTAVPLSAVAPGSRVVLEASWPAESAETFAYFDPVSQTVTTQRESMQVAWYATAGHLDTASTGRAADDPLTSSDDGWTAPLTAGAVHLWVVLRDSRGGVDFVEVDAVVSN